MTAQNGTTGERPDKGEDKRAEVARLKSMLAGLGGPLAVTAADCGSPGRSAEVASFTTEVER